jgi:multiple antibiotic resistance protein
MGQEVTLFVSTFSTLLAIINPLEALPVFLKMMHGASDAEHRDVARRASLYAAGLLFFFLIFGTIILKIFGVSLSMVRVVGGIVLLRIGFDLFSGSASGSSIVAPSGKDQGDIAFVPLAMPLMCGPGAIATVLGMTSLVKHSQFEFMAFLAIAAAIVLTMAVTFLCLAYAKELIGRIGPLGIDAITRIVGFFVAAMGGGLIFHGVIEALHDSGVLVAH